MQIDCIVPGVCLQNLEMKELRLRSNDLIAFESYRLSKRPQNPRCLFRRPLLRRT